jgi:hypothetical protein
MVARCHSTAACRVDVAERRESLHEHARRRKRKEQQEGEEQKDGVIIGALGVSGDTSCADHNIAWRARKALGLHLTPSNDNITYGPNGHPFCLGGETPPAP